MPFRYYIINVYRLIVRIAENMMEHLPEYHKRTHLVRHHECGPDGSMKLQLLLDCLQDIAAEHAEKLGCGMEDLVESKRLWVLSRLKLRILRKPVLKEDLELLTYPSDHDRLSAFRQYRISCGSEELVQGSSAWVMLDGATYRPIPMDKVFENPLPGNTDKPRYFEKFDKFPPFEGKELGVFRVGAGDIDLNCHLNNAVYARYITDALEHLQKGASERIEELQINFQHSGQLGDDIPCSGYLEERKFCIRGGNFFTAGGSLRVE